MNLSFSNMDFIENLYQSYLSDPSSIDPSWSYFFEGMAFGQTALPLPMSPDLRIYHLIDYYRIYGHLQADFNPIATEKPKTIALEELGFKPEELEEVFPTCGFLKEETAPLKVLIEALKKTYCGKVGIEYMGLGDIEMQTFLQQQTEPEFPLHLEKEDKLRILQDLNKAELFEAFLHTKYVGQKRFSLEGAETMIPMLSSMIEKGADLNVHEIVLGMAHRGRLNVLANIVGKSYGLIFHEFEGYYTPDLNEGTGDVKYHKGFVGSLKTSSGQQIGVTLAANPSHLESVDPVVEGIARAKQDAEKTSSHIVPILIHGDAAVAGQGVVYETLQLGKLRGYATGGTVHIIINNQIGFTTLVKDSRSTLYCSEIAKAFGAPVFHVNAEDPEGCVRASILALTLRQKFGCDVFIDLNCYRKYGHNEGDEPTFTQPVEYALIQSKPTIRKLFSNQLIQEKVLDQAQVEELESRFKKSLQEALEQKDQIVQKKEEGAIVKENRFATAVAKETLVELATHCFTVPDNFRIHPKIQKMLTEKLKVIHSEDPMIDWAVAEQLSFATLLSEGINIRLSGQDVRRGTFSHRHAIWVDQVSAQKYFPLSHLSKTQGLFDIFNSPLSEYAVLGFDFGYSVASKQSLVLWEAQYGDFANGAQIIIDQYIAATEQKWGLQTNIVLLLPHGYEGQGPEHSSARIERFLQLYGNDNMHIANCSTPAQLFHLLRLQGHLTPKKPLVLFTPKALLRHPLCLSPLNAFYEGKFLPVIDDTLTEVRKLLFCSGKIYYDILQERTKRGQSNIALVRIEQLSPFPTQEVEALLKKYQHVENIYWLQEEHSNMGPWEYMRSCFGDLLGAKQKIGYIGRDRSASPAAGSHALHAKQWEEILQKVFN